MYVHAHDQIFSLFLYGMVFAYYISYVNTDG